MIYSKDNLRQIFQQPFNAHEWQQMLQHYFQATELKAEPERIEGTTEDEQGYYLGAIDTTDSYRIGLFYYKIQHGNVARKRVGLRNLVKSFVNPNWGEFDAALVVFDSGELWRLSFVSDIKGESTAPKRYTYVFGESDNYYNTPVGRFDALQRNGISFENIKDAFSVERLNKDFFNGYKERYVKFLKHINEDTKENRDYVKKLLGRLVFLQFLQKKGWMGVPANQQGWNGGDKFYLSHLIERYVGNDRLLSDVLEPLFFNTLNERRDNDLTDSRLGENIKIPYLNGGLFDKDDLDKKDIDFPYDYFKELMDFFAMYNFTIDENDPEDSEIGIDPEMLGHIFENLLEDNKDKGAFYTPKEIVQYMSQESVAQYLQSHTSDELHTAIDSLIKQRVVEPIMQNKENARLVNKALSEVKVCDPAIGSGAFPMGVLNVLFDCRHLLYGFIGKNEDFSYAKVKRDIIQNNIYGVDIEKGAVDIARLRFWLALVVDENEPQPLPNLDYKIMCGDSLLHRFALDAPFQNVLKDYNQKNGTHYTLNDYRQWVYNYTDISDHTQKDNFRKRIEDIKRAVKTELSKKEIGKIAKVRGAIANLQMEDMFGGKKNEKKIKALQKELKALEQQRVEIESNKIYDQAFEWRFEFPALLNENGDFTGFDIVIGNPPYVQLQTIKEKSLSYQNMGYETFHKSGDMYCLFTEAGFNLLKENGILTYIMQNKWMQAGYGKPLRQFLSRHRIRNIIDFGDVQIFENATTYVCICTLQRSCPSDSFTASYMKEKNVFNYPLYQSIFTINSLGTDTWVLSSSSDLALKNKIENTFPPLKDYVQGEAYRGVLTGLTEAFIINDEVRNQIISEDKNAFSIIHPIIRGRDMKVWENAHANSYLIGTFPARHLSIDNYPGVKKWLNGFGLHRLEQSGKTYIINGEEIKARKKTSNKWFETQDQIGYFEKFACPKIMYQAFQVKPCFIYDDKGLYCNNSIWILPTNNKALLGIFNSKLGWWLISKYCTQIQNGYQLIWKYFSQVPIALNQKSEYTFIEDLVETILTLKESKADTLKLEQQIDLLVYHLYGLTYDEVLIVDPDTPITRDEYEQI